MKRKKFKYPEDTFQNDNAVHINYDFEEKKFYFIYYIDDDCPLDVEIPEKDFFELFPDKKLEDIDFTDIFKEKYNIELDLELAKKIINAYNEFRILNISNYCAFCDKELTEEEKSSVNASDFNYTCIEHKNKRTIFQVDLIRKELGLDKVIKRFEIK